MNFGDIVIDPNPMRTNQLYSQHQVKRGNENLIGKIFFDDAIKKYDLMEALDYNSQVLQDQYDTLVYKEYFLPIIKTYPHKDGLIFVTPKYDRRLDQYMRAQGGLQQQEVMKISEQLLKSMYGLIMSGFYHRNFRTEHFVRHNGVWKLQSLILNQSFDPNGCKTEYLWSNQHQPPQAYGKDGFTEEYLDQKMVWDFGCIVMDMLLGHHKLKNMEILNKFKGQPFSFEKINAKIGKTFSKQLKEMLGKMCHYNQQKRISRKQLLLSGFFCKEIVVDFKKRGPPQPKIYISGSSSASQSLNLRLTEAPNLVLPNVQKIKNHYVEKQKKSSDILAQGQDELIRTEIQFQDKIKTIQQDENEDNPSSVFKKAPKTKYFQAKIQSIEEIQEGSHGSKIKVIQQFKNYLDKGEILTISDVKLRKVLELYKDEEKAEKILKLTKYALNFVKAMDLAILAKTMNQNTKFYFFDLDSSEWDAFHGSGEYHALQKLVNYRKQQALSKIGDIRSQILAEQEFILPLFSKDVKVFVNSMNPQKSTFIQIKRPYRQILKKSYDLVADHYTRNKTQGWATIGMYLTFCVAVDKLYIHADFKKNFKFYFKWIGENNQYNQDQHYVPLERFQKYIEVADKQILVQNSTYIISKYFQI